MAIENLTDLFVSCLNRVLVHCFASELALGQVLLKGTGYNFRHEALSSKRKKVGAALRGCVPFANDLFGPRLARTHYRSKDLLASRTRAGKDHPLAG